jgi:hypothetical protein|tara:strand:+ start:387 stop:596 length:210 start_codon:yes stop_codon:yes gene_type:complete
MEHITIGIMIILGLLLHRRNSIVKKQQRSIDILRDGMNYINDIAPSMHKYSAVEYDMVMQARRALYDTK